MKILYCYFYSSKTQTRESKLNILILLTDLHMLSDNNVSFENLVVHQDNIIKYINFSILFYSIHTYTKGKLEFDHSFLASN